MTPQAKGRDDSFTTEFDEASPHRRTHGSRWKSQLASIIIGALLAGVALGITFERRVRPEAAALGKEEWSAITFFRGERLNAWRMNEWTSAYPTDAESGPPTIGLWLGNSQMHTVNQRKDGEFVASLDASEILGWPVRTLSLPNASLQDHLVMLNWALARRKPDWLIIGVVYDDLRENGLRPEYRDVFAEPWVATLESRGGLSVELAADLRSTVSAESGDLQGTSRSKRSTQQVVEDWLQSHLNTWPVWSERPAMLTRWELDVREVRNRLLRVDATTKRPMIPWLTARNMQAFSDILTLAEQEGIKVLVYIAPLRWNPEPPYFLPAYEEWKASMKDICAERSVMFLDLDRLVPDEHWGSFNEKELDFMHFQHPGHVLLGRAIGNAIRQASGEGGTTGS